MAMNLSRRRTAHCIWLWGKQASYLFKTSIAPDPLVRIKEVVCAHPSVSYSGGGGEGTSPVSGLYVNPKP